jgi:hypothetical protein
MRYVSQYFDLRLFRKNGDIAHSFRNGVLVIGDMTTRDGSGLTTSTKGYSIDSAANATTPEKEIMGVMKDFAGKLIDESGAERIECIGLGTLNKLQVDGATSCTDLQDGWSLSRTFFEAPAITPGATTVVVGAYYEVIKGTVVYNGVTYKKGKIFLGVTGQTTTSTTDGGLFALSVYPLLNNKDTFLDEEFKIKLLQTGNESTGYWEPDIDGAFVPRNGLSTGINTGFGYTNP